MSKNFGLVGTEIIMVMDWESLGKELKRGDIGHITKEYESGSISGGGAITSVEIDLCERIWPYPNPIFTVALPNADREHLKQQEKATIPWYWAPCMYIIGFCTCLLIGTAFA